MRSRNCWEVNSDLKLRYVPLIDSRPVSQRSDSLLIAILVPVVLHVLVFVLATMTTLNLSPGSPRLVSPSIDVPLASVQVERTDSLEMIPR